MAEFVWEARARTGEIRKGTMTADDAASVEERLRQAAVGASIELLELRGCVHRVQLAERGRGALVAGGPRRVGDLIVGVDGVTSRARVAV